MPSPKIIDSEAAAQFLMDLRRQGRRIVLCHGVWDLFHPGHIRHLEEAKAMGDTLVVAVTAAAHVNLGPGRPFFNDALRIQSLAALACVDYVILVTSNDVAATIRLLRPDVFCRASGQDEEGAGRSEAAERAAVEGIGGRLVVTSPSSLSAARWLNRHLDPENHRVREFCDSLRARCTAEELRAAVESFKDLRVLVVGETIFDRYSYVQVQGLTSKNRIISGKYLREETQCGGALAVYRHVRQFSNQVKFLSVVGGESWVGSILKGNLAPEHDLTLREPGYTTIIKQRFVEPYSEGKELGKLFAVNYIDAGPPAAEVVDRFLQRLREAVPEVDLVMLLDFGHGLIREPIRRLLESRAPILALNCQTNSNNHGFNIINRRYRRADAFSLDQQELMLACGKRQIDYIPELRALRGQLQASYAWLTQGPVHTVGLAGDDPPCCCPPLENEIVDTIGAGDAFFSVAALAAARKVPLEVATFLGQLAGAQAVRIIGNARPIEKDALVHCGVGMLNVQ